MPAPIADATATAEVFNGPGIPLRELEQRWGVSRNTVRSRADALGVEIIRVSSTDTRWPAEWLDLGDALHDHLNRGGKLADFPGARTDRPASTVARTDASRGQLVALQPEQLAAMVAALRPEPPAAPVDPLKTARGLVEAADLGVALSTVELAQLLGLSASTVSGWDDGHTPRPGFVIHRSKVGQSVWWKVERIEAQRPQQQLPPAPAEHRGFAGLLEEMARPAAYQPPVEASYRVVGRQLFDINRIG